MKSLSEFINETAGDEVKIKKEAKREEEAALKAQEEK